MHGPGTESLDLRFLMTWTATAGWAAVGLAALGLSLRARCRDRAAWIAMALTSVLFAVELAFPRRYEVTNLLRAAMRSVGGEEGVRDRRPIQAAVIAVLMVVSTVFLVNFLIQGKRLANPTRLALVGIAIALLGLLLETISLHQLDAYALTYFVLFNIGFVVFFAAIARDLTRPAAMASRVSSSSTHKRKPFQSSGFGPLDINESLLKTATAGRPPTAPAEPGHATYRLGDISAKAGRPKVEVDVLKTVPFVLALACLLYILGHAKVEGHEGAKFVGGLGSALLFGSVGAVVAGSPRRGLLRVVAFGLAFAAFGITFNLGLHPTNRPFWSADILQGMALSGVVVAAWRRLTGGGPWPYAALVALASSWWLVEPHARGFPGSQYLFAAGTDGISLFPVLPWLTLTALGAWLFELSIAGRLAVAVVLGVLAAMGWSLGPIKFPLNPIYAMAGGSLASASFAVADLASRTRWVRVAADWLGQRWLLFFYLHLGIAPVLARLGLTSPLIAWPLLAALSLAATWVVSLAMSKLKFAFEWPASWAGLFVAILAVGLVPGIPAMVVVALAGGLGLIFAARHDDLAALILGPTLTAPLAASVGSWSGYAAKVMLVVAVLAAPELLQRLPAPFGTAPATSTGSEAGSAARVEEP